jgi:eukaryotic-like serine/threonine-protein kinase
MDPNYPGGLPPDPIIGMTIGNYQVRQKLGEGGMGSVYLAEHPHIGKKVALKVLHAEFASNTDVVTRFFNEAKAVNDIGHPNIVDVIDYGVLTGASGEGVVYFIMEFLPGATLSQLLQREAPLSPERALSIALQVGDALSASHKSNIVHRDLKPDNIILIQRGREHDFVKLLDFGIAKLTGDQPGSRRTRTGLVMGTPAYMSPEQCEGRGNVDHRADIYALGIVLYEMITGRVPFFGEGYGEVLVQHLTQPPTPPTTIRGIIPPHVEQIVLKALEKRPEMRYPTMDEMSKAMADPVGYVESHGGIANFLATPLAATNDPVPPISRLTPSPITRLTPVPGALGTPTTLGGAAGAVARSGKKPIGLFIGIGAAVVAAAVAVVVITSGGKSSTPNDHGGEPGTVDVAAKNRDKIVDPPGGGSAGSAVGGSGGSSALNPGGSGSGSAGTEPGSSNPGSNTPGSNTPGSNTPGSNTAGSNTAGSNTAGSAVVDTTGSNGGSATAGAKVSITVSSSPSGAFVTFGEETEPRGKTPVTFEVDKVDADASIEISMPGYKDEERTIRLSSTVDLEVPLTKKSRTPGGHKSGSGSAGSGSNEPGGHGDDMMDPFAAKKKKTP